MPSSTVKPILRSLICIACWAGMAGPVAAGIFGDPEAGEATADDRIALGSDSWWDSGGGDWSLATGTIHCDGRQRGSAIILSTESFGPEPGGLVLATAAHVLFDLETGRKFDRCSFHYMGLSQLPGYQADVDLATAQLGGFDPARPLEAPEFGQGDWAFLHVPEDIPAAGRSMRIRPVAWEQLLDWSNTAVQARLLAWSIEHDAISLSLHCRIVHSEVGDLGGGSWQGQLLDDCDSGEGASGGGLLARFDGEMVLVGIRTGAHWDAAAFPAGDFPFGPPPGTRWDRHVFTNFSRAIDQNLLEALRLFLGNLDGRGSQPTAAFLR